MGVAADIRTITAAGLAVAVLASPAVVAQPRTFPAPFDGYLAKYVRPTADQQARLARGEPVSKLLDADASKEVVVFGAVWIAAPIEDYLAAVHDIERFESGGSFVLTKKIGSPPRLEDFDRLSLPRDDIEDLRNCKVGACQVKLPQAAIERIRQEVDWNRSDAADQVNAIARTLLLGYVNGYLEGGNARLGVYRDSERPTFVEQEFASMIDRLPSIGEYLPDVRRYLLEFPNASLPDSESFLYWQETSFGLKPTIRINHLVTSNQRDGAIVASKMLYASHYFWTALELRVLLKDPSRGPGFWFITETRSRSDGLSGFVGRFVRGKARSEAERGTAGVLRVTKDRLERH